MLCRQKVKTADQRHAGQGKLSLDMHKDVKEAVSRCIAAVNQLPGYLGRLRYQQRNFLMVRLLRERVILGFYRR